MRCAKCTIVLLPQNLQYVHRNCCMLPNGENTVTRRDDGSVFDICPVRTVKEHPPSNESSAKDSPKWRELASRAKGKRALGHSGRYLGTFSLLSIGSMGKQISERTSRALWWVRADWKCGQQIFNLDPWNLGKRRLGVSDGEGKRIHLHYKFPEGLKLRCNTS